MINTKRMMVLDPMEERVPLTFTRASVAYDLNGVSVPVNTPRFEHLINGNIERGVLIEEAHTNLLTANQSTGTDSTGDTSGFVARANTTISSSTTQVFNGTKSLKCVCGGVGTVEGMVTTTITLDSGVVYSFSAWVYAPLNAKMRIQMGSTIQTFTGTGTWQFVYVIRTTAATSEVCYITTDTDVQAITFYIDRLQLTKTAYPLSWTLGGTTQAAELLTAPSSVLDLTQGTIEMEFVESPGYKNTGNHYLFEHQNLLKNRCSIIRLGSGHLINRMANNVEQSSNSGQILDTLDLWSNNTVSMSWDSTILNLFLNGVNSGSPAPNPYLPEVKQTIYLGGHTNQCNTLIRNITISKSKRGDTDITARSNTPGFGKDRQVTLHAPLMHDLKAVRVRR